MVYGKVDAVRGGNRDLADAPAGDAAPRQRPQQSAMHCGVRGHGTATEEAVTGGAIKKVIYMAHRLWYYNFPTIVYNGFPVSPLFLTFIKNTII
ncbi:hypothetical protein HYN48_07265 [Flavobacterium magnum]|uniref:Uncharacterized protein n=1 Tax=Flavobacterium magnum TaxID=2162713 RepID=A0A2S0RGP8_9FLAO|nr:hypothetical protein HYN48_07265 [Flavobacterium magnum]